MPDLTDPDENERILALQKERHPHWFMDGYRREPKTVEQLVGAFRAALYACPTLRAGQLLWTVLEGQDLYQIFDEDLTENLVGFLSSEEG